MGPDTDRALLGDLPCPNPDGTVATGHDFTRLGPLLAQGHLWAARRDATCAARQNG